MKKILLSVLFVSTLAQAEQFNLNNEGASRFDVLNSYFQTAELPTVTQITGAWSGRCYLKNDNKPKSSLLAAQEVIHRFNENEGPLFPPTSNKTFNLSLVQADNLGDSADLFDNLTPQFREL
ncbi:MAG: hypothetical protein ACK5V3_13635 [Bdellovibrionales bacterium]